MENYKIRLKKDEQIAKELASLPKSTTNQTKEIQKTNKLCACGRDIKDGDVYYIKIEPNEMPEVFCEMCISEN